MTEAAAPAVAEMAKEAPRSLWVDAWRRLLKNRFAVAGLAWLGLVAVVAALAPVIVPFDPQQQEWWIGKRAPFFAHATLANRMIFKKAAAVPEPFPAGAASVKLAMIEVHKRDVRVEVDHTGTVVRMELGPDYDADQPQTDNPETLSVKEPDLLVLEGTPRLSATNLEVKVGGPAPRELGPLEAGHEKTFVGQLRRGEKMHELVARLASGKVSSLEQDGKPLDELEVEAEVTAARVDDVPFTHRHPLGTDDSGRDILSRVIFGARISLLVGIVATFVSLVIGVSYGAASGYAGGRTDELMMRFVDILYAVPFMFIVIILLVLFGRSLLLLFGAIGAVEWLTMARIVRGQVLSLKEKEYVEAARVSGTSGSGIVFGHLIPNCLGSVIVYTTLTIPEVILTEAFLSFLGLSVQYKGQNLESWGSLTNSGLELALGGFPWLLLFSALALSLTLFAFNFLGDGLRDALDPRMRGKG